MDGLRISLRYLYLISNLLERSRLLKPLVIKEGVPWLLSTDLVILGFLNLILKCKLIQHLVLLILGLLKGFEGISYIRWKWTWGSCLMDIRTKHVTLLLAGLLNLGKIMRIKPLRFFKGCGYILGLV